MVVPAGESSQKLLEWCRLLHHKIQPRISNYRGNCWVALSNSFANQIYSHETSAG